MKVRVGGREGGRKVRVGVRERSRLGGRLEWEGGERLGGRLPWEGGRLEREGGWEED